MKASPSEHTLGGPTLDAARAIRALEDAGLDPDVAEGVTCLVDEAVQNAAARRLEFAELKLHVHKSEQRVTLYLAAIIALAAALLANAADFESVAAFLAKFT